MQRNQGHLEAEKIIIYLIFYPCSCGLRKPSVVQNSEAYFSVANTNCLWHKFLWLMQSFEALILWHHSNFEAETEDEFPPSLSRVPDLIAYLFVDRYEGYFVLDQVFNLSKGNYVFPPPKK